MSQDEFYGFSWNLNGLQVETWMTECLDSSKHEILCGRELQTFHNEMLRIRSLASMKTLQAKLAWRRERG